MLHLQSLGCLVTLVWYLLLQLHGGVTEQDAVLAAHMLHLGWQALENLLTLLERVALLGREQFQNMIFLPGLLCDLRKQESHLLNHVLSSPVPLHQTI